MYCAKRRDNDLIRRLKENDLNFNNIFESKMVCINEIGVIIRLLFCFFVV